MLPIRGRGEEADPRFPGGERTAGRLRESTALVHTQPPHAALVHAAFATLAGLAALAMVVLAVALLSDTKANPGASPPAPGGSGVAGLNPSPSGLGAFPNAAERALLDQLDPSIASFCQRAAASQYPVIPRGEQTGTPVGRLPVLAGLRCPLGGSAPDLLSLWAVAPTFRAGNVGNQAFITATVGAYFFRRVADAKAGVGDCATDDLAYTNWSFGLRTGKLLCVATPARARFDWTFDDEDLIATAERDDGDRAALYQWWLEEGRVILH